MEEEMSFVAHMTDLRQESYRHRYRGKLQRNSATRRTRLFIYGCCINPLLKSNVLEFGFANVTPCTDTLACENAYIFRLLQTGCTVYRVVLKR